MRLVGCAGHAGAGGKAWHGGRRGAVMRAIDYDARAYYSISWLSIDERWHRG